MKNEKEKGREGWIFLLISRVETKAKRRREKRKKGRIIMLRQLASRAAASSSQLCGALSASSMALSCSTRAAVATEVFRCARRGAASNDCDGPRSLSPSPMIATSSGRSSSSTALDPSFVPSTSYSVTPSWGRPGAQMWTRVRDIGMRLNQLVFSTDGPG